MKTNLARQIWRAISLRWQECRVHWAKYILLQSLKEDEPMQRKGFTLIELLVVIAIM